MSKKIMSVMLAIFMLASLCVVGITSASAAYSDQSKFEVEATGGENMCLKEGESLTVTLAIDSGLHAWQSGQFTIYFDSSKFSAVNPRELEGKEFNEYKKKTFPGLAVYGNEQIICNLNNAGEGRKYGEYRFNFSILDGLNVSLNDDQCRMAVLTFTAKEDIEDLSKVVFAVGAEEGRVYTDEKDFHNGAEEVAPPFVEGGVNEAYINDFSFTVSGGTPIVEPTDPTNPTDPTDPTNPTDPTDPTNPTDPTEIDTAELEALVAEAKELATKDGYTADSIAALNAAIEVAEGVLADPQSQEQVDEQVVALSAAIDALETENPTTTEPTESSEATTEPSEGTTASTTAAATTEAPAGGSQQTGQTTTAIALVVVALMAAGVVIFARKKATK